MRPRRHHFPRAGRRSLAKICTLQGFELILVLRWSEPEALTGSVVVPPSIKGLGALLQSVEVKLLPPQSAVEAGELAVVGDAVSLLPPTTVEAMRSSSSSARTGGQCTRRHAALLLRLSWLHGGGNLSLGARQRGVWLAKGISSLAAYGGLLRCPVETRKL
jgi:hypothetical protein